MTTTISIPEVIATYEAQARANRPDWDRFIEEAREDPLGIFYEVTDVALTDREPNALDDQAQELLDAVRVWLEALS